MRESLSNIALVHDGCRPPAPTPEQLAAISVGYFVEIVRSRERFWIKVTQLEPLEGTVDNDMLLTADHGLSYGDVVQFNQSEIIQTLEA